MRSEIGTTTQDTPRKMLTRIENPMAGKKQPPATKSLKRVPQPGDADYEDLTLPPLPRMLQGEYVRPKTFKEKATQALKGALSKTKDVASDVISAPQRYYYDSRAKDFNQQAKDIKLARNTKKAEKGVAINSGEGHQEDPLFRARINSINEAYDKEHQRRSQTAALEKAVVKK